jgi:transposase
MEDYQVNCLGDWKEKEKYDIRCPLLPDHGKPNLTRAACELRQKNKLIESCYGGCYVNRKKRPKRVNLKIKEVIKQGTRWRKMHQRGISERKIAAQAGFSITKIHRWISIANQEIERKQQ